MGRGRCGPALRGIAVVHSLRFETSGWQIRAAIGALAAALMFAAPAPARAGFLDFLFGPQARPTPPADVNSYAEPPAPRVQLPTGRENLRLGGSTGHGVAFCVRLCDGLHFPLEHLANATPVETCRAMCPASRTKVFFGSEIDRAAASDGARYADLDSAFVYRQRLVPNCTCNGKDAFGLAHFDLSSDPTLRPGDMVATKDGFVAYAGKRGQGDSFTPVDAAAVAAELNPNASRVRLARRGKDAAAVDEPGVVAQPQVDIQAVR
jgi:hypothetical protein